MSTIALLLVDEFSSPHVVVALSRCAWLRLFQQSLSGPLTSAAGRLLRHYRHVSTVFTSGSRRAVMLSTSSLSAVRCTAECELAAASRLTMPTHSAATATSRSTWTDSAPADATALCLSPRWTRSLSRVLRTSSRTWKLPTTASQVRLAAAITYLFTCANLTRTYVAHAVIFHLYPHTIFLVIFIVILLVIGQKMFLSYG